MAASKPLALFGRATGWIGTLNGTAVAANGADTFAHYLARLTEQVNAAAGPLTTTWPDGPVLAAAQRAAASADRFTVLGVGAGVLQLGFCLVVAAGLRRRQQLVGRLLERRGAGRGQLTAVAVGQTVPVVLVGLAVGAVAAAVVVASMGRTLPAGAWSSAGTALSDSAPTLIWLALAAVVATVAAVRWPDSAAARTVLVLDVATVLALGLVVLVLLDPPSVSTGTLSTLTIVSAASVTGLVAARLWEPAMALAGRLIPPRHPLQHMVVRTSRRRPLVPMVTAGFLAAACCSLVFAVGFRASLAQSAADQGAFTVPLDARIAPSAAVAVPLDAVDATAVTAAAPDADIEPVVTSSVTAAAGTSLAKSVPWVGLSPSAFGQMHELAAVTGSSLDAAALATAITPADATTTAGSATIPAGALALTIPTRGANDDITVVLWVATPEGRERGVAMERDGDVLLASLGASTPLDIRAIEITESSAHLMHRQHGIGEGSTDRALASGTLQLGAPSVDGRPVGLNWSGWGSAQATVSNTDATGATVDYQVGDSRVVLTPHFVPTSQRAPIPVLADPDTAARATDGRLGVLVNGQTVPLKITAVLPRLPTFPGPFLVADRAAMTAVLDATAPGTAAVTQVWIGAPSNQVPALERYLRGSPAAGATLLLRSAVVAGIADDPVAVRAALLLAVSALVALALAVAAGATAVRSDLAQAAVDLFALEIDGLPPPGLRRILLGRATLILLVGVPLGLLGGLAVTAVAVRLLVTGPDGATAIPPLRVVAPALSTTGVIAVIALGTLLAAGLAALAAFRAPHPRQPDLDLR